jgi:hypothetical protein
VRTKLPGLVLDTVLHRQDLHDLSKGNRVSRDPKALYQMSNSAVILTAPPLATAGDRERVAGRDGGMDSQQTDRVPGP